jgi:hypothetical protein
MCRRFCFTATPTTFCPFITYPFLDPLPSILTHKHNTATSLRLFVPNKLQAYRHFFFSKDGACSICDRSHFPTRGSAFRGVHSPIVPAALSLRQHVPVGFLIRCQSVQDFYHHPASPIGEGKLPKMAGAPTFTSLTPRAVCFPFRRGRPLHSVSTLIFHILTEDPAIRFTISSTRVFLKVLLNYLLLRSCCLGPLSLIPLLHSGPFQHLFSYVLPFWVPLAI